jgi:hypothetical protein
VYLRYCFSVERVRPEAGDETLVSLRAPLRIDATIRRGRRRSRGVPLGNAALRSHRAGLARGRSRDGQGCGARTLSLGSQRTGGSPHLVPVSVSVATLFQTWRPLPSVDVTTAPHLSSVVSPSEKVAVSGIGGHDVETRLPTRCALLRPTADAGACPVMPALPASSKAHSVR